MKRRWLLLGISAAALLVVSAPTGKLGVDASPAIGFDVYSAIRNGTTVGVRAFASLSVAGSVWRTCSASLRDTRLHT